jgi:hypothetical protein
MDHLQARQALSPTKYILLSKCRNLRAQIGLGLRVVYPFALTGAIKPTKAVVAIFPTKYSTAE